MKAVTSLEDYFEPFRNNTIGSGQTFAFVSGEKEIVYADWTASARGYRPIESHLQHKILPYFANTHTQATTTGTLMTHAYEEAKAIVKRHVHANDDDVLVFCGSGMTAAVNKLQRLLGFRLPERCPQYVRMKACSEQDDVQRPVVFVTHMEHHSNHISWLETIATVEIIAPTCSGNVDLEDLERLLLRHKSRINKIAAITAASNVTGIQTPCHEIARIVHAHGGVCFVDFASSAPYVPIDMHPPDDGESLDAIYFSMHKFLGGPGTPGVLIFNQKLYNNAVPDQPGGGTVVYSNPWQAREYISDIETREDGGTPPILQGIKAAMCIRLKEQMGVNNMLRREQELLDKAFARFDEMNQVTLLQGNARSRLGIISFMIKDAHHSLIVKLLNDKFGIQTRGGCSCAGTYGHHLLNVDHQRSMKIWRSIQSGDMTSKPGWVRVSFHPTMSNREVDFVMDAIEKTSIHFRQWSNEYIYNKTSNEYELNGADKETNRSWDCFNFDAQTLLPYAPALERLPQRAGI